MSSRWTEEEIAYLQDHAGDGAAAVAMALGRSMDSVIQQARRYGLSLRRRWLCPFCGMPTFTPLNTRTGWCRTCSVAISKHNAEKRNIELQREVTEEERRYTAAVRARQTVYTENDRLRRKAVRLRSRWQVIGNQTEGKEDEED